MVAGAQPSGRQAAVHEDPQRHRDWEHWPGRKAPDEGIRRRLKALFSATEDATLEARIEEKGREIEEHTDQLQATISDLERREARAGQLRTAVEEMLRQGSAELDERHAALTQLSLDLAAREEKIRADERDIAVRKQELGAVELRRAAVERREAAQSERAGALEQLADDLAERERRFAIERAAVTGDVVAPATAHDDATSFEGSVLFFSNGGYRLIDRPGPALRVGDVLDVDDAPFVVVRVGRSRLPGDRRGWAYLEPRSSRIGP
jgi:hypothetical protein